MKNDRKLSERHKPMRACRVAMRFANRAGEIAGVATSAGDWRTHLIPRRDIMALRTLQRERNVGAQARKFRRWGQRGGRSIESPSVTARTIRSAYGTSWPRVPIAGRLGGRGTRASTGRTTAIVTGTGTAGSPEQRAPEQGFG